MAFKKGDPKPEGSGRKKGAKPSRKTLLRGLDAAGFDITAHFLDLMKSTEGKDVCEACGEASIRFVDPILKLRILKEIARYTQPAAPKEEPDPDPPKPTEPQAPAGFTPLSREELVKALKNPQ